jgi:ectoine hydroxylase-related dioxygenase (phytanoyl-CoA dioxygenase family)
MIRLRGPVAAADGTCINSHRFGIAVRGTMLDVTGDQIAKFNEDGFLIVDRIVDAATVEELRAAYDRMFRGEFETGVWPDEVNWQEGESDPSLTRQICNGWRGNLAVARVVLRADFGRAIALMGGWPGTRIMTDNVLWKPPTTRPLGYHQDSAYLAWYTPSDLLSLWIALDDTSAEGGTLEFVRGSHRWNHRPPEGEFHGPHEYQKYMRLAAEREGVEPEIVPVVVPKGGGSFHHGWTWHGSGYNRSERPRRSLVLHAMRSDTRYVPAHLTEGTGRIYSRYKRLADDEIDENYFPVLWRKDGYRTPGIDRYLAAG